MLDQVLQLLSHNQYFNMYLCSYAVVHVEVKNQGEEAFKPETYGDVIIIERRISDSTSSTILKDHQGCR